MRYVGAEQAADSLQEALDNWSDAAPALAEIAAALEDGAGEAFDPGNCLSPLPRAYQWADGSAYVNHVELVRKARGAQIPESFWTDPLMYQGGSDSFIGPHDPILAASEDWGIDFEAEVTVVTDDVPMGVGAEDALSHIKLIMIVNDVSLRNLIPGELAKGFGFFQSKPSSAFAPVAVTPDELGDAWRDGKLHLPLLSFLNGEPFGKPDAGIDMTFRFGQLIAHAAKTRPLCAGSIIGSGTISNKLDGGPGKPVSEGGVGYSCIAEIRMIETIESGKAKTSFMKFGDRVRIEMLDAEGNSIFGAIDHEVRQY
jgi:fumarylacetoacetate (FAA) hydrolase